jgi:hypothetical protein
MENRDFDQWVYNFTAAVNAATPSQWAYFMLVVALGVGTLWLLNKWNLL